MQIWQYLLLAAIGGSLMLLAVTHQINESRRRKLRDFTRRLETLLLPKEEVNVICRGVKGRWILTNQRLILEDGEGFQAFPFSRIKKVTGMDDTGKATAAAGKMTLLTVKTAEKEFSLRRREDTFPELVKGLKSKVAAQRKKEAAKKKPKQ